MHLPTARRLVPDSLRPGRTRRLIRAAATCGAVALAALALAIGATASDVRQSTQQPEGLRTNVPQVFALVGADVVVRPGEVIEGATIIVRDERIAAVGEDVPIPRDAQRIDLSGKRVYPGFIDAFSQLPAEQSARDPALADLMAANYWNSHITPQIDAARILSINSQEHERLRQVGIVARHYAPGAGLIKGSGALVSTTDQPSGDRHILAAPLGMHAQLHIARGRGRGYPGSPMGAMTLVRQALYDAQWYEQARQAIADDPSLPRPERNDALAALRQVIDGEMPVFFECRDELFVLRSDKVAGEFDLKVVLVGSGSEYRRGSEVIDTGWPMILPLDFPRPPNVSTPELADSVTLDQLMHWDLAPENLRRLHEGGVKFAMTTNGLRRVDREFWTNLRRALQRGLPGEAALRALTVDAAEILGVEDGLGTIEEGKLASFVVADGELFEPRSRARVMETWTEGRRHVIVRPPVFDARGTWRLELPRVEEDPVQLELRITGRPERLSGRATRPEGEEDRRPRREESEDDPREADSPDDAQDQPRDEPEGDDEARRDEPRDRDRRPVRPATRQQGVELRNLRQTTDRLSFTLAGDRFGMPGVIRVSLTAVDGTLRGMADLPDGTRVPVRIERIEEPPPAPPEEPDAVEAEMPVRRPQAPPGEDPDTPRVPPSEDDQPADPDAPAGTAPTIPPDPEDPPAVELEETPTEAERPRPDSALFDPVYPLGAFGRESHEAPEQPETRVFVNATIWTCADEGKIERGYIVVQNGTIAAVGSLGDATIDEVRDRLGESGIDPDVVVDCEGMHITPGIIDCHSHIATNGGINEGTRSITCMVRIADFINPDDINIYRQLAGGVTAANILHGSANTIGGQNAVIKFRWGQGPDAMIMEEAPPGVKFALGENVKQSNWSSPTDRYPQTRMGVVELINDAFRRAQDYQRAREQYRDNGGLPVRIDLELEALSEIVTGERLIHCHSYRQDEILAVLRVLEEFGITIGSFQHILEGYKVASEMANHGATASAFSDWWAFKIEAYDAIPYAGAIMHNAGVVVSFNSDDAELGRRMNLEAAKAMRYGGVPAEEALKFVTLNPAKQLQIDEWVGSIEEGKHADLVLWSGPPLSTRSRVEQTWIDGRKYFDREDDAEARRRVAEMRAKLIQRVLASGEQPVGPGESPPREEQLWPNVNLYCADGCYIFE